MKPTLRLAALGALVYVLSLVFTAPAAFIDRVLPDVLQLQGLSGSLWSGSAHSALLDRRIGLGPITWHFRLLDLLRIRLGFLLDFSPPGLSGQGRVSLGPLGFEANAIKLECEAGLFNAYVSDLGDLRGHVSLNLDHVTFSSGHLRSAEGTVEWKDARLRYSRILRLGIVKADIKDQGNTSVVQISNTGGDLKLAGSLSLDRTGGYQVRMSYTPTSLTPEDVRDGIKLMGQPDATGGVTLERKGRFGS